MKCSEDQGDEEQSENSNYFEVEFEVSVIVVVGTVVASDFSPCSHIWHGKDGVGWGTDFSWSISFYTASAFDSEVVPFAGEHSRS